MGKPEPPLSQSGGRPASPEVLTDHQRLFAQEHHNLIYAFLREKGQPAADYYDIAAFGFLRAVRRYLTRPELKNYSFSTVAWRSMSQSISSFHRAEALRRESERKYAESVRPPPPDPFDELEARLLLYDLARVSTAEQYTLARLRLQGFSIAESALAQGMSVKRVRRLLRKLYHVYLELYQT